MSRGFVCIDIFSRPNDKSMTIQRTARIVLGLAFTIGSLAACDDYLLGPIRDFDTSILYLDEPGGEDPDAAAPVEGGPLGFDSNDPDVSNEPFVYYEGDDADSGDGCGAGFECHQGGDDNMSYVEYGQHRIVLHEHAYGGVRNGMRYAQWWDAEGPGYGRQSGVAKNYNDDVSTIDFCNGGNEAVTLRLTLYEHTKYQGDSWSFVFNSNPMSCTRIDRPIVENFNDRTSSWRLHYL